MSSNNINNNKWVPIPNVDPLRRKPHEWAKIYHIKLHDKVKDDIWSEYEWAYNLFKLKYTLIPDKNGEYDKANEMELRALELKRDLFMGADDGEKYVLEKQYIETEWIRSKNLFI